MRGGMAMQWRRWRDASGQAAGVDSAESAICSVGALLAAGRAAEAVDAFRAAVKRKPDFAAALYHQALAHRALNEPKEVRRSLIQALEIEPQLARAWHALATLDAEAGNLDIAAGLFRKAIEASRITRPRTAGWGRCSGRPGGSPRRSRRWNWPNARHAASWGRVRHRTRGQRQIDRPPGRSPTWSGG